MNSSGYAYITGTTASNNFPTTLDAYQSIYGGGNDVFVSELAIGGSESGDLLYSTYVGGSGDDGGNSIDVDASGNVYVTGNTKSSNFPVTSDAYQGSFHSGATIYTDAFVTKLQPLGLTAEDLVYSTFLGTSGEDVGMDIAFLTLTGASVEDRVYVTGYTNSATFPTTFGAYDTTLNGTSDAFVSVFNFVPTPPPTPTGLSWSAEDACSWLTAVPTSGSSSTNQASFTVNIDTTGMPAGTYQCALTVTVVK